MTSAVQYAIVGTGSIGTVLAQRFSDHHVPALWANTRGPETIDVTELSASITPATLDTALDADVIVLAIPFLKVRELGGRRADWSGKIVVDTTNAFLVPNSEQILGGRLSTEFNAEAFPGAAVVCYILATQAPDKKFGPTGGNHDRPRSIIGASRRP